MQFVSKRWERVPGQSARFCCLEPVPVLNALAGNGQLFARCARRLHRPQLNWSRKGECGGYQAQFGSRAAGAAIQKISRPVQSRKEKAKVAAISAHNDSAMGELVADAMEKVGPEGAITVEEARTA